MRVCLSGNKVSWLIKRLVGVPLLPSLVLGWMLTTAFSMEKKKRHFFFSQETLYTCLSPERRVASVSHGHVLLRETGLCRTPLSKAFNIKSEQMKPSQTIKLDFHSCATLVCVVCVLCTQRASGHRGWWEI